MTSGVLTANLSVTNGDAGATLSGDLVVWTLRRLSDLPASTGIELSGLTRLDTAGASTPIWC